MKMTRWIWCGLCAATALVGCNVGNDYKRPLVEVPGAYASTQPGTQPARITGKWWELFGDPDLNAVEEAAIQANPNLQAAMARVRQARAAARVVRSQFYPVIEGGPSLQYVNTGEREGTGAGVAFDLSYEVDLWGRVRRSVESANATATASAYDFGAVLLTLEADVAQNYMNLRSFEAQARILTENVKAFEDQLALIRRKNKEGIVGNLDIVQAQSQLDALATQMIDIQRQRRDAQHALAILTGRPPSEFSLETKPLTLNAPPIPPGMPGDILRNRPDIAEAEQNLVAANADVAVALAEFYPKLTLTGLAGFQTVDIAHTLDWQSRILQLGANLTFPLFEGGRLKAALEQQQARYDELVAIYKNAILTAFRDVEIALNDVHMRGRALDAQQKAVQSAAEYLRLSNIEYNEGILSHLQLLDANRTLLSSQLTEEQLRNDRLLSTVLLIKSLGGGWKIDQPTALPAPSEPAAH